MDDTALVIGGSVGGLLAAAALSETFDEVLLVEKAVLSDEPVPRPSVPQGSHAHGLLAGGLEALAELLPGLLEDLAQAGCPTGDNLRDAAWVFAGRRLAMGESGVRGMTVARPVLEAAVRARVLRLPNVRLRTGLRVTGLLGGATRVTGVRGRGEHGHGEDLPATLVVDASGRSSKLPDWLGALGLAAPRTDEVAMETRYVSRVYTRSPRDIDGAIALLIVSEPDCPRGGIALALDDERWLISQYAMGGERPPADHEGFLAFARRLPSAELAEILERAAPRGDASTLKFPSSVRRRYEREKNLPEGLLVFGDAFCSFNPTFGQGITVAAKQALVLRDLCAKGLARRFERTFLKRAARIVDVAWDASVGRTFLYPGVVGRPTLRMRVANAVLPAAVARAHEDPAVATALLRVMHFLAPPESLFAPKLLWRIFGSRRSSTAPDELRSNMWQARRGGPSPDPIRDRAARQNSVPGTG